MSTPTLSAMNCPHCLVAMIPPGEFSHGRWQCPACPRRALSGESDSEIEEREQGRVAALSLIESVLLARTGAVAMGQGIETKGCPSCGGTMWRTIETDDNGNPIGGGPFVCQGCGASG